MNAGELRERVTIERESESRSDSGEVLMTYTPVATVWAAVEPLRGREYFDAQRVQAEVNHRIRIRYRDGIEPKMRVSMATGRTFDIESAINVRGRDEELHLMCREVV